VPQGTLILGSCYYRFCEQTFTLLDSFCSLFPLSHCFHYRCIFIVHSITAITSREENAKNDTVEDLEPVVQVNNHTYKNGVTICIIVY